MNYETSGIAPFSQDAEEAVLGSLLINSDAYWSIAAFLRPEHFYILRHAYIFEAMMRVAERNDTIDLLTVREELRSANRLNDVGGPGYLTQLTVNVPTSVHVEVYGRLVERASTRRQLLTAADEMRALAMDESLPLEEVGVQAWQRLERVNFTGTREKLLPGARSISHYDEVIQDLAARHDAGELVGYSMPDQWTRLNEFIPMLFLGDFVVFSGGSGSGKSSMLEALGEHYAALGERVNYIHTEMTTEEVLHRRMSRHSGVPFHRLASGDVGGKVGGYQPYTEMVKADQHMAAWVKNITYHYLPDVKFERLATEMRRAAMMGVRIFLIDHFQDIVPPIKAGVNEVRAFEQMCVWLNAFAEVRGVLVIVASQLNDAGKVKWTRKLVEKADVWVNIKRERLTSEYAYTFEGSEYRAMVGEDSPAVEVFVNKARFGKKGKVKMLYHGSRFMWLDMNRIQRPTSAGKVLSLDEMRQRQQVKEAAP